jgi:hypothetical protein
MVMVYISRYGAKFGDGDKIKWEIGEKATFIARNGFGRYPVTIASHFIKSPDPDAGDDLCIEVTFDTENDARYCVSAKALEPRGGFPPFTL